MMWQFIRRHGVRIVIVAVLAAGSYAVLAIWIPYHREQRITRKYGAANFAYRYCGPDWIPRSYRKKLPFFSRASALRSVCHDMTLEFLGDLGSLACIEEIQLLDSDFTGDGLEHLNRLTMLHTLALPSSKITDSSLEHLKVMTCLRHINLKNTQTTSEGRAMLRKALPDCKIEPDP